MQVSPPFSPDEGAIRTFPSHSSAHTLPSHSSVSTIPDGLVLTASFSDEESLLARGLDNGKYWLPFDLPGINADILLQTSIGPGWKRTKQIGR